MDADHLIVGAGVVGAALARELTRRHPKAKIVVLEKEPAPAAHTSGRNSGVVHAGYNQKPGTLKARLCVEGNRRLRDYAKARGVPLAETGILVMATKAEERSTLVELLRRGRENGVPGLRLVEREELTRLEPNAKGPFALHAPSGAAVASAAIVLSLLDEARAGGAELLMGEPLLEATETGGKVAVRTPKRTISARRLINCAGLHADRVAHALGAGLDYTIVPFRGEFYYLAEKKASVLRSMLYNVPDLEFPFLGVHWTKTYDGKVKVGPNAVLALGREAYELLHIQPTDTVRMLFDRRFWKMAADPDFRRLARENLRTSLSRRAFLGKALELLDGAAPGEFEKGPAGIRAQLVDKDGRMVDDLLVEERGPCLHVLNAVSPGLTCALPFAELLAERLS